MEKYQYPHIKATISFEEFKTWVDPHDIESFSKIDTLHFETLAINTIVHIRFFNQLPPVPIQIKGSHHYDDLFFNPLYISFTLSLEAVRIS